MLAASHIYYYTVCYTVKAMSISTKNDEAVNTSVTTVRFLNTRFSNFIGTKNKGLGFCPH